jgi:transcriptional regulator with XRE-family HTH domain
MDQGWAVLMQESAIRKAFGARVKELRKQRQWTQKELAEKLGIRFGQLNKYESGLHTPPVDKLVQLAEIFDTTIDFLLTGDRSEQRPLHNTRLVERLQALEEFQADDQETVIKLIDAMILKHRVQGTLQMTGKAV